MDSTDNNERRILSFFSRSRVTNRDEIDDNQNDHTSDRNNPNLLCSSVLMDNFVCVSCDSYFAAESLFCWHNFDHLHKVNNPCCTDCPSDRVTEDFILCKMTVSILKLVKYISEYPWVMG